MNPFESLYLKMHSLTLFRSLLSDPTVQAFTVLLRQLGGEDKLHSADTYCDFAARLYHTGGDWSQYLLKLALEQENAYLLGKARGEQPPEYMEESLVRELAILQLASEITSADAARAISCPVALPKWANSPLDFAVVYRERMEQIYQKGYGIFARYHVFSLGGDGTLLPVKQPDKQRLADLTGYEAERRKAEVNTLALLKGLSSNNVLLYGDAGTGKSSTVKAIANEYAEQGLRLIEVKKYQLHHIPALMEQLADNPLKFILFIDDLSFSGNDENFTALKAILEGSVSARSDNMVVYATSNRRHLVKESFADRAGDDLHLADTLEEVSSLSARFGLTITFSKPDKDLYCSIVENLAAQRGLTTPLPQLLIQAEAYAIRNGGRSPRTARQFVEYAQAMQAASE